MRTKTVRPVAAPTVEVPRADAAVFSHWGEIAIAVGVFVLAGLEIPKYGDHFNFELSVAMVLAAAGLPLLVARLLGRWGALRSNSERWAARCLVGFLVVGSISALLSASLRVAVFGEDLAASGLLCFVILAGVWALGTGLGSGGRRRLETAIIAAAAVNAGLSLLQEFFNLNSLGLGGFVNQPDGVFGNPVFFGALLAGTVALLGPRFLAAPRRWWAVTALVGAGLGVSGARLPALLYVCVPVAMVGQAWRRRARQPDGTGDAAPSPSGRAAAPGLSVALGFAAVSLGALLVGSYLPQFKSLFTTTAKHAKTSVGVITHVVQATGSSTFGQRQQLWSTSLHAFAAKPLFGWGPGQFLDATSAHYPLSFALGAPATLFLDSHNIILEVAVTTGLLGLLTLAAWFVLTVWNRTGPLLHFAVILLLTELVEPLNYIITTLAFVALGAAALTERDWPKGPLPAAVTVPRAQGGSAPGSLMTSRRPLRVICLVAALLTAIPATVMMAADIAYLHNYTSNGLSEVSAEKFAESVLPWPEPVSDLADLYVQEGSAGFPGAFAQAIATAKEAVARDPQNGVLWGNLAYVQGTAGQVEAAKASALQALKTQPYDPSALDSLGISEMIEGHRKAAELTLYSALVVEGGQPDIAHYLKLLQRGCTVDGRLRVTCPKGS